MNVSRCFPWLLGAWFFVTAPAQGEIILNAHFSQVTATPGCEAVFEQDEYVLKLFLMGPTGRTLVINHQDPNASGFLHLVNLVTNRGYENDFLAEKTVVFQGHPFHLKAEGFFTHEVLYATYEVEDDAATCTGRGELTGFLKASEN